MTGSGANKATWTNITDADSNEPNTITVFTGTQALTAAAADIETTRYGTLVIPQTPTTATVKYKYKTPAGVEIEETSTVSLSLVGAKDSEDKDITYTDWQSGTRYIYTLKFTQSEILISATVNSWEKVNQNVSVN